MTIGDEKVVAIADAGPWHVAEGGKALHSDDFRVDARLVIDGDFIDDYHRKDYADWLAKELNGTAASKSAYAELAAELAEANATITRLTGGIIDETVRADAAESQLAELRATLQGIADANYQEWDDGLNTPFAFVTWAKSRAAHAISKLAAADGGDLKQQLQDARYDAGF